MKQIIRTLCDLGGRFRSDRRGNVALIFGISLIPILGLVGAAVDYSRANAARVKLQASLDATALMMAQDAANIVATQGTAALATKADQAFSEMYKLSHDPVVTNYDGTARTLELKVTAQVANTPFYKFFSRTLGGNQESMPIGSSALVKWGSRLRVALALDTTGSMNDDGKIGALKTAVAGTGGAIDQLSTLNL